MWRALIWLDKWINDRLLKGRWETISGHCRRAFFGDRAGGNPHNLPWV